MIRQIKDGKVQNCPILVNPTVLECEGCVYFKEYNIDHIVCDNERKK